MPHFALNYIIGCWVFFCFDKLRRFPGDSPGKENRTWFCSWGFHYQLSSTHNNKAATNQPSQSLRVEHSCCGWRFGSSLGGFDERWHGWMLLGAFTAPAVWAQQWLQDQKYLVSSLFCGGGSRGILTYLKGNFCAGWRNSADVIPQQSEEENFSFPLIHCSFFFLKTQIRGVILGPSVDWPSLMINTILSFSCWYIFKMSSSSTFDTEFI